VEIPFVKMHGAANDFVVIDDRRGRVPRAPEWIARLCDRRRGVGADGVLMLETDPELDFAMRYWNSDGGEADWCGNGARCIARFALMLGLGEGGGVRFRTAVGIQEAQDLGASGIALEFGRVAGAPETVEVEIPYRRFRGLRMTAGVPHFVTWVEPLDDVPVPEWGRLLRNAEVFGTSGANVDFIERFDGGIAMRTYERGVEGETLACGSGAIASAITAHLEGIPAPVRVRTRGGDDLLVGLQQVAGGWQVRLTGPAEIAFHGTWSLEATPPGH
jgi:diaminopimelate epimerase